MNDRIHEHHDGISRQLWGKYKLRSESLLPSLIADGIVEESEAPEELLSDLRRIIDSMRRFREG